MGRQTLSTYYQHAHFLRGKAYALEQVILIPGVYTLQFIPVLCK